MFALLLKPISSVDLNYKYIIISNIYLLYLKISMNFKTKRAETMKASFHRENRYFTHKMLMLTDNGNYMIRKAFLGAFENDKIEFRFNCTSSRSFTMNSNIT